VNSAAILCFLAGCWYAADFFSRRVFGILCWTLGLLTLAMPLAGWVLRSADREWPFSLGIVLGAMFALLSLIANILYVVIHVWRRREASVWLCLVPVFQSIAIAGLVWFVLDLARQDELAGCAPAMTRPC
jgi:hypothetical protein